MSALPCPVENPFAAADQDYAAITEFLSSKEAWQVEHSELERELEGKGRELLRKLLQAHLQLRQPGQAVEAVRDAAGTPLAPTAVHERGVESIFGTVEVARTGYGAAGTASVHPLDGALNLPPEKYSLEVRRRVAMEAAKSSFDEGTKTLEMYTGAHVPKRQFEELTKRAAQDFQAFYTQRQAGAGADPQTGSILVLTVDGKGVVMQPEDLREPTQRAAAARAKTFTARLGSGRRLHAKRMASVAAIYTVQPFVRTPEEILPESPRQQTGPARPRPEHKRVWASLAQPPEEVIGEMFDEAQGSEGSQALGGSGRWQSPADCSSRATGGEAGSPADHRRRFYPCVAVCLEGGGRLVPQPGVGTRSLDARAPAGDSAREGQPGGGRYAPQCHAAGDGRGAEARG
jgi:hypothetical protein